MKKIILSVLLMGTSLVNFFCFASSTTLKSPTNNLLFKRRGQIASQNPLVGQKKQYLRMQMRERNVQDIKKQLRDKGKTPEEIRNSFLSLDTSEETDSWNKLRISNIKYQEYEQAQDYYNQNPSPETLLSLQKADLEWKAADQAYRTAYRTKIRTPEYRAAEPDLATPTKPIVKLDFYTGKPTPVSSKPIMQPSQDSYINRFLKWLRIY